MLLVIQWSDNSALSVWQQRTAVVVVVVVVIQRERVREVSEWGDERERERDKTVPL